MEAAVGGGDGWRLPTTYRRGKCCDNNDGDGRTGEGDYGIGGSALSPAHTQTFRALA